MASAVSQEWRLGWRALLGTSVILGTGLSVWPYVASTMVEPLQHAFGWSRGQIAWASNASIGSALIAPVIGRLTDRIGVRPVVLASLPAIIAALVGLANVHGSLRLYYLFYALFVIGGVGTTGVALSRNITSRFVASRGLALSLVRIGTASMGAILPGLLFVIIARFGWQGGFYALAALAGLCGLPACWLCIIDRPETLAAGGAHRRGHGIDASLGQGAWAVWRGLFGSWRLWVLCAAAGTAFGPLYGLSTQIQPLLAGEGLSHAQAAEVAGVLAIASFAGTLATGMLCDAIWAPLVAAGFIVPPLGGCLILMAGQVTILKAGAAVASFGLAMGAVIAVLPYLTARYFDLRNFGATYGLVSTALGLGAASCGVLYGRSYDVFGGYVQALQASAACLAVSTVLYLLLGRYPPSATPRSTAPH